MLKVTLVKWYRIATLARFSLASSIPNKMASALRLSLDKKTINVIYKVKENQVRCILEYIPCTRY